MLFRIDTFKTILGHHIVTNRTDRMTIEEIELVVNREAPFRYTRRQISSILEVLKL